MTTQNDSSPLSLDFEDLVARYYQTLYRFAFSLTRSEADAADLTQHTFYIWALKGAQLRERSKVKTWMLTTLHRAFLQIHRRQTRFPHYELEEADAESPLTSPDQVQQLDSAQVLAALERVDEVYRAPVALFYLEDCSYRVIAERLQVPIGTVKSRIARGIVQLRRQLEPSLD